MGRGHTLLIIFSFPWMPLLTTPADWQPLLFLLQHPTPVYAVLKLSMLKVFSANRLPSLKVGLVYIYLFTHFFPHQNSLIYFLPSFIEPSHSPLLNGMTLLYIPHNSLESSLLLCSIFAIHYPHLGLLPSHLMASGWTTSCIYA